MEDKEKEIRIKGVMSEGDKKLSLKKQEEEKIRRIQQKEFQTKV